MVARGRAAVRGEGLSRVGRKRERRRRRKKRKREKKILENSRKEKGG